MTDQKFVGLVLAQIGRVPPVTWVEQGQVQATLRFLSRLLLSGDNHE